jgi:hypothetical protein
MKKYLLPFLLSAIIDSVCAQSPDVISYQAVMRNTSNQLIPNKLMGIQISVIQGTAGGAALYTETHKATSNVNGLITLEIGKGVAVAGEFSKIDWSKGPYFLKTETDPSGGNNYTITGNIQLLSVPYALHAKTAENIKENDPVFNASVAKGISSADTARWNKKLGNYTETDPLFNQSVAKGISKADTAKWNKMLSSYTETDPIFGQSVAKGISKADTAYWNSKLDSYAETDPVFDASVAKKITANDTARWGKKQNKLIAGNGITINKDTIHSTAVKSKRYIGERFGGGVIFHLWQDSLGVEHGLIVGLTDLSTGMVWSNVQSTSVGSVAQSSWDGSNNSIAIAAQSGHTSSAANTCLNWSSGGYSDWFLPSVDMMTQLWQNRFNVNMTLSRISGATQVPIGVNFWTSTELSATNGCGYTFGSGYALNFGKGNLFYVRAIRSF